MNYAQRGNRVLVGGVVGYGTTIDGIKQTFATARIFNDDVRNFAKDEAFKKAWNAWYAVFSEWADTRITRHERKWTILLGPLATNPDLVNADEIAVRAAEYRQDLARFQATYATLTSADGKPLPSNAPSVQITPPPPQQKSQEGIPLWVFLAGAAAIGAGVFIYWRVKKTGQMLHARQQVLEKDVLPIVFGSSMGPELGGAFAKAATARDAVCGCEGAARDLDVKEIPPRAATRYLLSGS